MKLLKTLIITAMLASPIIAYAGNGGGSGKVHVQDLSFGDYKSSGIIIAVLAAAAIKNERPKKVTITFSKAEVKKFRSLSPSAAQEYATTIITRGMKAKGYTISGLKNVLKAKIKSYSMKSHKMAVSPKKKNVKAKAAVKGMVKKK